jgi:hypothetical protein
MKHTKHEGLGNERTKGRNHLAGDPLIDFAQYVFDPRPVDDMWRTFAERYEESRGLLHVHFRVVAGGREVPQNFCAAFNRSPVGLGVDGPTTAGHVQADGPGAEGGDVGEPVLVFDRKVVKHREGVLGRVLALVVRLQFLEIACASGWMHPIVLRCSRTSIGLSVKMGTPTS